jgi:hypothetical protein
VVPGGGPCVGLVSARQDTDAVFGRAGSIWLAVECTSGSRRRAVTWWALGETDVLWDSGEHVAFSYHVGPGSRDGDF